MTDRQTGYPSVDKPWLKYYKANADEEAQRIPKNKTVWDVIEESLYKHIDIPAMEYFGRVISRKEFIDNVYLWAKAFIRLGIKENEIVAYYGPFMPDVCFILFALNMIGACPYFLKLAISSESLAEETQECRIAIVFDQMWDKVCDEFSKERFEKVIFVKISDAMAAPKKQIVSVLSARNNSVMIPKGKKYITVPKIKKMAKGYDGKLKAPFVEGRSAFITSSSGTTIGGVVKGVVASNESVISQVFSTIHSDTPYRPGDRTLNHFPPTASTSLNSLCFVGLMSGATIVIDPRVTENDFYNQLTILKPSMCINTSSLWETFFDRVTQEMKKGCKFDFSYARGWMIGGEGTTTKKYMRWNQIMKECGANGIYGGYGTSETFSGICIDRADYRFTPTKVIEPVGVPQAGMEVGIFDKNDRELSYNQRGELRVKTKATMKGYYNKPELTEKTVVNGWVHTGDLAEIDENGFVYIWGRLKDTVKLSDGREIYLFDISNKIKEKAFIDDAIVLEKPIDHDSVNLVAHIVWDKDVREPEKAGHLSELVECVKQYEPGVNLIAFAVHDVMLPYSPTTLKKDKNRMAKQTDGFVTVADGIIKDVQFSSTSESLYKMRVFNH